MVTWSASRRLRAWNMRLHWAASTSTMTTASGTSRRNQNQMISTTMSAVPVRGEVLVSHRPRVWLSLNPSEDRG